MTPSATLIPFFVGFVIALAVGALLLAGVVGTGLARNRKVRLDRHESIPAYYRGMLLSH